MELHLDMQKPDWCNLAVLAKGRLAPRGFVFGYPGGGAAAKRSPQKSGRAHLLNGKWRFAFFENPNEAPEGFFVPAFDDTGWDTIPVPAQWEFHGYGRPHYTDSLSVFPVAEEPVPPEYAPTGLYRTTFAVPDDGLYTLLRFEGVESGYHLWVNGKEAGYSQGSRMAAEFDVSALVHPGKNTLAVAVYKFTDGSYLENQDMWWLGGIFRDVWQLRRPAAHFENIQIDARLLPDGGGVLDMAFATSALPKDATVAAVLQYSGRPVWQGQWTPRGKNKGALRAELLNVQPWSAEAPALYELTLTLSSGANVLEAVPLQTGFRRVEIDGGLLKINGVALRFKGMNYHHWDAASGRAYSPKRMRAELEYLKQNNVNALRTSHYPQPPCFYDLCDELGFYVVDEADLECCMCQLYDEPDQFASSPLWRDAFLDRVQRLVAANRNHPCVVMWSLGNESGYGPNFAAACRAVKKADPTRPVHYEEDRKAKTADVYSSMYTGVEKLEALGKQDLPKPHVMCEYAHAMGNGPGSLEDYWALFYRYPRLQGGFLWEFKDHTIRGKKKGKPCLLYGGDFGDEPNGGNFCGSGLLLGDGTPTPAMAQVKHALSPVRAEKLNLDVGQVALWNRFDFLPLDVLGGICMATADGEELFSAAISLPAVAPGECGAMCLPPELFECDAELITIRFYWLRPPAGWHGDAPVDTCQFRLRVHEYAEDPAAFAAARTAPSAVKQGSELLLSAGGTEVRVSTAHGTVEALSFGGAPVLSGRMDCCFFRAPLDNDRTQLPQWQAFGLDYMQASVLSLDVATDEGGALVKVRKRYAPYTMNWHIDAELEYRLAPDGVLRVRVHGAPQGKLPPTFGRIGLAGALAPGFDAVRWHGRGPEECYCDSKAGTPVGLYETTVDGLHFPYAKPQENGNRADVDWLLFANGGRAVRIEADAPFNFSAHHYTLDDLRGTSHNGLLPRREEISFHLDAAHHGLGCASWGPDALEQYTLRPEPFDFAVLFCPWSP